MTWGCLPICSAGDLTARRPGGASLDRFGVFIDTLGFV